MSIVPTIIAAQAARQREEEQATLDAFRVAHATAPERARRADRLPGISGEALARLVEGGIVRSAGWDRYYLDETAVVARREGGGHRALPPGSTLVVGLLVLFGLVAFGVIGRS